MPKNDSHYSSVLLYKLLLDAAHLVGYTGIETIRIDFEDETTLYLRIDLRDKLCRTSTVTDHNLTDAFHLLGSNGDSSRKLADTDFLLLAIEVDVRPYRRVASPRSSGPLVLTYDQQPPTLE